MKASCARSLVSPQIITEGYEKLQLDVLTESLGRPFEDGHILWYRPFLACQGWNTTHHCGSPDTRPTGLYDIRWNECSDVQRRNEMNFFWLWVVSENTSIAMNRRHNQLSQLPELCVACLYLLSINEETNMCWKRLREENWKLIDSHGETAVNIWIFHFTKGFQTGTRLILA